ncbi:MAG TPA: PAS domain S-box protein [Coleofasciculaceae cyanobacterium]
MPSSCNHTIPSSSPIPEPLTSPEPNSVSLYCSLDAAGVIQGINSLAAENLGYPIETLLQSPVWGLFHPEDQPRLQAAFMTLAHPINPLKDQVRLLKADGHPVPVKITVQAFQGMDQHTAFLLTAEGMPEQMEIALRQSEERYRRIVETSNEGIWEIDAQNNTSYVNARMAEMLGYRAEEMLGRSLFAFMDEAGRAIATTNIERRKQGITEQHDFKFCRKDGSEIWVILSTSPILDDAGQYAGAIATVMDITDRKQAEAELRQSEERWQLAIQGSHDGIWDLNIQTKEIFFSDRCATILGYEVQELGNFYQTWISHIHPDDVERVLATHQSHLDQQIPFYLVEYRVRCKDGSYKWILDRGQAIWDQQGNPVRIAGSQTDISDRKRAELELKSLSTRLNHLLTTTPAVIFSCQPNGNFGATYISENVINVLGYPPQQFLENSSFWINHIHPEDRDRVLAEITQPFTNQAHSHEFRFLHANGHYCWLYEQLNLIKDEADHAIEIVGYLIDISDRKQAEAALRQSEARFRTIFENTAIGIMVLTPPDCKMKQSNPAFQRMLGYSAEELTDMGFADFTHAGDLEIERQLIQQVVAEKRETYTLEKRYICKNGQTIWINLIASILWDADQQMRMTIVMVEDINDRKQAEMALRQQAQQAQAHNRVVQAIRQSLDLNTIFSTAVFEIGSLLQAIQVDIVQYLPERQVWLTVADHIQDSSRPSTVGLEVPDDHNPLVDRLKRLEVVQVAAGEDKVNQQNEVNQQPAQPSPGVWLLIPLQVDQQLWGYLRLKTLSSPWQAFDVKLALDIADQLAIALQQANLYRQLQTELAERQQAEAALRDSEARFRKIFADAPIGMAIITLDGQITQVNQSLCQMLNYSEPELTALVFHDVLHPGDREEYLLLNQQLLNQEIAQYKLEKRLLRRNGEIVWVSLIAALLQEPYGDTIYTLGMFENITERRTVEQMKDNFVSIVSHELRTPLTSICGSLGLLATGQLGTLTSAGQEILSIAISESKRLVRLVSDILDLERLKSGHISLVKEPCPIPDLLARCVDSARLFAHQAGINIEILTVPEVVWVDGDRIIQAMTNLLNNAIKFSASGTTVWITAQRLPEATERPDHSASPLILIEVKDQGRGIPPEKLQIIFEPFEQVEAADFRHQNGSGLGLAICQNIIQAHGGQIWATSTLGKGSSFFFTLPLPLLEDAL